MSRPPHGCGADDPAAHHEASRAQAERAAQRDAEHGAKANAASAAHPECRRRYIAGIEAAELAHRGP